MKKSVIVILVIFTSIFAGYKLYSLVNKSEQFKKEGEIQYIKSDVMGEIESISESEIIVKIINFPTREHNKDRNNGENKLKEELKIEYTDEKKSIVIHSDIKIFKSIRNDSGVNEYEISISDLKVGDILILTYNKDKSLVNKILVRKM